MPRMRNLGSVAFLALAWLSFAAPAQAQPLRIPPGGAAVDVPGAAPDGGPVTIWTYRPAGLEPTDRIVFVMHGVLRNADVYRDNWIRHAQANRFLLVVPEMTRAQFPGDAGYNFGNMVERQGGAAKPPAQWAWRSIEKVFDAVRTASGSQRQTYSIFGHSAGAQFVHRLVTYADNPRVDAAIAANAGWYTLPVFSESFPYGLTGSPASEERVRLNLQKPLVILLGDQDTNPSDPNLRRDAGSDRQGKNRFERGQFYVMTGAAEAMRLGVPFGWKTEIVPGVGHNNDGMSNAAVRWLFPKK